MAGHQKLYRINIVNHNFGRLLLRLAFRLLYVQRAQ